MSISGRKHIRWLPPDKSSSGWLEPTSTLVLTSKKHNYYTDIRVSDNTIPPRTGLPEIFPAPPSPVSTGISKPSYFCGGLEWAFAGQSVSFYEKDDRGKSIRSTTWHHWVDSHYEEDFEDKGSMWEYGENLTLEKGQMLNPASGNVEPYEEVWREMPVEVVPAFLNASSMSEANSNPTSRMRPALVSVSNSNFNANSNASSHGTDRHSGSLKISMVLRGENQALGIRGLVVRVGGWVQGVIKTGKDTSAERWMWKLEEDESPKWEKLVRIGFGSLPCRALWEKEDMVVGDEVLSGGLNWEVVEKEVWV